jgi:hypothetical protein
VPRAALAKEIAAEGQQERRRWSKVKQLLASRAAAGETT